MEIYGLSSDEPETGSERFMVFWAKRRLARLARLLSELVTVNQPQLRKLRRKLKKSGVTNTVSKSQR